MASDASEADELPSVDEQLLQAINILKLCGHAGETSLEPEEFDMSYPLWAALALLEEFEFNGEQGSKIITALSIVKATAVTLTTTDQDIGTGGFEPSWCLDVAIELIGEVIADRAKKGKKGRTRSKRAMREISTVDPDCARQFHRLLMAAGKLPVAELERLARYAEIELTDGKKKPRRAALAHVDAPKASAPTEPELRP